MPRAFLIPFVSPFDGALIPEAYAELIAYRFDEHAQNAALSLNVWASKQAKEDGRPFLQQLTLSAETNPIPPRNKEGQPLVKGDAAKEQDTEKFYTSDGTPAEVYLPEWIGYSAMREKLKPLLDPFIDGMMVEVFKRGDFKGAKPA